MGTAHTAPDLESEVQPGTVLVPRALEPDGLLSVSAAGPWTASGLSFLLSLPLPPGCLLCVPLDAINNQSSSGPKSSLQKCYYVSFLQSSPKHIAELIPGSVNPWFHLYL